MRRGRGRTGDLASRSSDDAPAGVRRATVPRSVHRQRGRLGRAAASAGYRLAVAKAPLRETLAAAMLAAVGWDGREPLIDPLCGSGTIPIEAALLARRIPPGLDRVFACMRWPRLRRGARGARSCTRRASGSCARAPAPIWARTATPARSRRRPPMRSAPGSPRTSSGGARRSRRSRRLPDRGWIVTNPPYGVRLGDRRRLRDLFAQLGNVARRCCPGWGVAFLATHTELERQTGLEPSRRVHHRERRDPRAAGPGAHTRRARDRMTRPRARRILYGVGAVASLRRPWRDD